MNTNGTLLKKFISKAMFALLLGCSGAVLAPDVHAQPSKGFPDARMRDFERQRACELKLPTCLPQIRRQMKERDVKNIWMSGMIVGVLFLVALLAIRANKQKKIENEKLIALSSQAARQRKEKTTNDDDDDLTDGRSSRSTLERPPGFGRR